MASQKFLFGDRDSTPLIPYDMAMSQEALHQITWLLKKDLHQALILEFLGMSYPLRFLNCHIMETPLHSPYCSRVHQFLVGTQPIL